MISELQRNNFTKVLHLFLREEIYFPLILAVIQQKQPGWIFVDEPENPTSAFVITDFGFTQFSGTDDFAFDVIKLLEHPNNYLPSYILWYSPSYQIRKTLDKLVPTHIRQRERVRFTYPKQTLENPIECPDEFRCQRLDQELIRKTDGFKLDITSRFWTSANDFLENGIGFCVLKGNDIVSLCYSAGIANNLAEVDIITKEEYRGQGLAIVAGQNFIAECLLRGITPTWDCFANNTASLNLAKRLGFSQIVSYSFYSFNIPLACRETL